MSQKNHQIEEIILAEIFNSIQGEFPDVGYPYTFVRFKACNLHCPFCILLEDNKNFYVYRQDLQQWLPENDLEAILSSEESNYILAGIDSVTTIEGVAFYEFDHYYKISVRGINRDEEFTFSVSYDHMFATVDKRTCYQEKFELDNMLEWLTENRFTWTPASMLDKDEHIILGPFGLYEITDIQIVNEPKVLAGLATGSNTFVYGNVIHHNCDSAKVMKYGKVRTKLSEILDHVKKTGSILFTGGEPGLYKNYIAAVLRYLLQSLERNDLDYLYSIALETNGYNLNDMYSLLENFAEKIGQVQEFNPKVKIAWSPKMYDEHSFNFSLGILNELKYEIGPKSNIYVKLVYDEQNLNYLRQFLDALFDRFGNSARLSVALMPEGQSADRLLDTKYIERLAAFALQYRVAISPRLHIIYNLP